MATVTKFANANTVVTTGWTSPTNAYADDGVYATCSPAKNGTVNTDYGFPDFTTSDIPAGSTINSVTMEVQWKVSTTSSIATLGVQLLKNGSALASETTDTTEPTADSVNTNVVSSGISLSDVQSASTIITARVRAARANSNTAFTASLDYVKMTVNYTPNPNGTATPAVQAITVTSKSAFAFASDAYSAAVLVDSPAGYWRVGEASGTVAHDLVAGNNGVYTGSPTLGATGIPGSVDTAGNFTQVSGQSLDIADKTAFHVGDTFSFEIWIKRKTLGGIQWFANKGATGGNSIALLFLSTNFFELADASTVTQIAVSTTAITDTTTWHHIVCTKSGSTIKLYLDKVDVTSVSANQTLTSTTSPLIVANGLSGSTSNSLDAYIDEVALYPTALSSTRVAAHYDAGVRVDGTATTNALSLTVTPKSAYAYSSAYAAEVMADSPNIYLRLGEVSGSAAVDVVRAHNGVYDGSPTLGATGAIPGDTAMSLSASTQFAHVPSFSVPTAAITLEAWTGGSFSANDSAIMAQWASSQGALLGIFATDTVSLYINGTHVDYVATGVLRNGNLHHIVGTWDGTNSRLYFDGVLVVGPTAASGPITLPGTSFYLGQYGTGVSPDSYDGTIDEVAVYDHALTGTRIAAHYAAATSSPNGTATPNRLTVTTTPMAATASGTATATTGLLTSTILVKSATATVSVTATPALQSITSLVKTATATGAATALPNVLVSTILVKSATAAGTATVSTGVQSITALPKSAAGLGAATATTGLQSVTALVKAAAATGTASVTTGLPTVTITVFSATAGVFLNGTATPAVQAITVLPKSASAVGFATAAPNVLSASVTARSASATGGGLVVPGTPSVAITPRSSAAQGSATASTGVVSLQVSILPAIAGVSVTASPPLATISISLLSASASGAAGATVALQSVTTSPLAPTATGTAQAGAALQSITITAKTATAQGAGTSTAFPGFGVVTILVKSAIASGTARVVVGLTSMSLTAQSASGSGAASVGAGLNTIDLQTLSAAATGAGTATPAVGAIDITVNPVTVGVGGTAVPGLGQVVIAAYPVIVVTDGAALVGYVSLVITAESATVLVGALVDLTGTGLSLPTLGGSAKSLPTLNGASRSAATLGGSGSDHATLNGSTNTRPTLTGTARSVE